MDAGHLNMQSFEEALRAGDSSIQFNQEYRKLNNDLKNIAASKGKLMAKQRAQPSDYVSHRRVS